MLIEQHGYCMFQDNFPKHLYASNKSNVYLRKSIFEDAFRVFFKSPVLVITKIFSLCDEIKYSLYFHVNLLDPANTKHSDTLNA